MSSSSSSSSSSNTLTSQHPVSCLPRAADVDTILASTLQPCLYRIIPQCARLTEYCHVNQPPSDWTVSRHRDLPCIFRDTLLRTWWTADQQRAIAATFTAWDSDTSHPLLNRRGYVCTASTLLTPATQTRPNNHRLQYYVGNVHVSLQILPCCRRHFLVRGSDSA
jgi:hypothetical protein